MSRNELIEHFGEFAVNDVTEINALRVAEHNAFGKSSARDYREMAVDRVINARLPFASTCNTTSNVAKRILTVRCPYCMGKTKSAGSYGSGSHITMVHECAKCGAKINLTMEWDAISAEPKTK